MVSPPGNSVSLASGWGLSCSLPFKPPGTFILVYAVFSFYFFFPPFERQCLLVLAAKEPEACMQLGRAVGGVVERSQPKLNSSPFHLSSHPISPDPFFPPRSGQPAPPMWLFSLLKAGVGAGGAEVLERNLLSSSSSSNPCLVLLPARTRRSSSSSRRALSPAWWAAPKPSCSSGPGTRSTW